MRNCEIILKYGSHYVIVDGKIIVAEIRRRKRSAVEVGQDWYYRPHGKARGQDVEANIER